MNLIGKRAYADLYYNDIYGLKKTFSTSPTIISSEDMENKILLNNIENAYL